MRPPSLALCCALLLGLALPRQEQQQPSPPASAASPLAGQTFTGAGATLEAALDAATEAAAQAARRRGLADATLEFVVEELGGRRGGLIHLDETTVRIRLR